jgi:NADPH:quinone reductase-like Zn-dependent oxidoreductase
MKVYQIHTYGGPEGLKLSEVPDVVPNDNDVIVQMRAVFLNYRDLVVIAGRYDRTPQAGRIPLSDGAGEVVAIGSAVKKFKLGDRVAGCFLQGWSSGRFKMEMHRTALGGAIDGVLAERVRFGEEGLVHLPANYSFEEGATLPCAAVTAWHALFVKGGLNPGEIVLCLGAGGVSIFALQLAKAAGAKVIITSSSAKPANIWKAVHTSERSLSGSGTSLDGLPLDLTNCPPEVILRPFLSANVA